MGNRFFQNVVCTMPVAAVGVFASLLKINQMGRKKEILEQQARELGTLLSKALQELEVCRRGLGQTVELVKKLQDEAGKIEGLKRKNEVCIEGLRKAQVEAGKTVKGLEEKLRVSELQESRQANTIKVLEEKIREIETQRIRQGETIEVQEEKLRVSESEETQQIQIIESLQKQLRMSNSKTVQQGEIIAQLESNNQDLETSIAALEERLQENATSLEHVETKANAVGGENCVCEEETEATETKKGDLTTQPALQSEEQGIPRLLQMGPLDDSIAMRRKSGEILDPEVYLQNTRKRRKRRTKNGDGKKGVRRIANKNGKDGQAGVSNPNSANEPQPKSLDLSKRVGFASKDERARQLKQKGLDAQLNEYFALEVTKVWR